MAPTLRPKIYAVSTPQGRLIKPNSRARYELYLKSQDALGKKLRAKDSATDNVRRLLKKARTTANRKNAELKASRVREAQARAEADALKKALQTQANNLIKFFMSQGMDKAAATAQARSILETQINEARKRKG